LEEGYKVHGARAISDPKLDDDVNAERGKKEEGERERDVTAWAVDGRGRLDDTTQIIDARIQ
jgi:hypothetical protein